MGGKGGKGKKAQLAQSKYNFLQKKSLICYKFQTSNQINYGFKIEKKKKRMKTKFALFSFAFLVNSRSISPFRIMRCITSPSRCKRDTTHQHDYFLKGLYVLFAKKNFFI
jgi:hypothetical protein